MTDPLRWRLVFAGDEYEDEPEDGASIRLSHAGALELHIIPNAETPLGHGVARIGLLVDGIHWLPVFYRRRYLDVSSGAGAGAFSGTPGLEATVFGRAWDDHEGGKAQLWAAMAGKIVDCPEHLIDGPAITGLLAR